MQFSFQATLGIKIPKFQGLALLVSRCVNPRPRSLPVLVFCMWNRTIVLNCDIMHPGSRDNLIHHLSKHVIETEKVNNQLDFVTIRCSLLNLAHFSFRNPPTPG